jgi:hypothetical protein
MSFGGGDKQASQTPQISGIQIQSSVYGKVIPLVYGTARLAPNLIWYGDFVQTGGGGTGGKGGGKGGGGGKSGGSSSGQPQYQAAVALALCEGPITGVGQVWADKSVTTPAGLGLSVFTGTYPQTPWGYLATPQLVFAGLFFRPVDHTAEALGYSGTAYVAGSAYPLGNSAQLPNHNFEVLGVLRGTAPNGIDADPSRVVTDLLTNPNYGAGFPAARLGSLAVYQSYTLAAGLWISPAYTEQRQASDILDEIAASTNSAFVWSSGVLTLVPFGDQALAANGYSYTPPTAPLYDLGDDDFLPNTGTGGQDPVQLSRLRPADALNDIKLECCDRQNQYNVAIVEAKDQAMVDLYGLRADSARQAHLFADPGAARQSAQLQLQREAVRNTYTFALDQRYILLDPMDIVTLTDPALGLMRQWVRITEIAENDDGTLSVTAEEYLAGAGAAATYSFAQSQAVGADFNAPPGNVNAPIFFEPPDELAGDLELWIALSGPAPSWGGCDVWISGDNVSYQSLGRFIGAARMGTLTAPLSSVAAAGAGPTIDGASTLSVDISESSGQLISGSQQDALAGNTLCFVDGELVAFEAATLTGAGRYDLSYLNRGLFGSPIGAHKAGSAFARLDGHVFQLPFTQDRIGQTVYFKFVSFNPYQGGLQQLAQVQPYAYTFQGSALASPLPIVPNLVSTYAESQTRISWDEVKDFRAILYEIRLGASPQGGQILGRVAHPPFVVPGDGTYWVAAVSQPIAGLTVYSQQWSEIVIGSAVLNVNAIAARSEAATGWKGAVTGSAFSDGLEIVLDYPADILVIGDWLDTPDILHIGQPGLSGTYQIPAAHEADAKYVAPCIVSISYAAIGQVPGGNLLAVPDYLGTTDLLGNAASANIDVFPLIQLGDFNHVWGAWQKFVPGVYNARYFRAMAQLGSNDAQTQAILEDFSFAVYAPERIDDYIGVAVPAAGLALTYQPNGTATPAPFNGGPGGAALPQLQVTILGEQPGDTLAFSNQTLAGCTVQILNGGAGVQRSANILAKGF